MPSMFYFIDSFFMKLRNETFQRKTGGYSINFYSFFPIFFSLVARKLLETLEPIIALEAECFNLSRSYLEVL